MPCQIHFYKQLYHQALIVVDVLHSHTSKCTQETRISKTLNPQILVCFHFPCHISLPVLCHPELYNNANAMSFHPPKIGGNQLMLGCFPENCHWKCNNALRIITLLKELSTHYWFAIHFTPFAKYYLESIHLFSNKVSPLSSHDCECKQQRYKYNHDRIPSPRMPTDHEFLLKTTTDWIDVILEW